MGVPLLNASRRIGQTRMLGHDTRAKCMDEIYDMNRRDKRYFENLPLSCICSRNIDIAVEIDWQNKRSRLHLIQRRLNDPSWLKGQIKPAARVSFS